MKVESATVYTVILFQDASISYTNGHSGNNRQVEITLAGRARSREDLCPDRPKSRFEHAVWPDQRLETQDLSTPVRWDNIIKWLKIFFFLYLYVYDQISLFVGWTWSVLSSLTWSVIQILMIQVIQCKVNMRRHWPRYWADEDTSVIELFIKVIPCLPMIMISRPWTPGGFLQRIFFVLGIMKTSGGSLPVISMTVFWTRHRGFLDVKRSF